jgi:hypothetical protein
MLEAGKLETQTNIDDDDDDGTMVNFYITWDK